MSRVINVVIHGRRSVVRTGLRWMLEGDREISVVGEADGSHALLAEAERDVPDVVIIEGLEDTDGWLVERLSALGAGVVVMTNLGNVDGMLAAFAAGAKAYLLREASQHDVCQAVRVAADGGTYIDPALAAAIVENLSEGRGIGGVGGDLSLREKQVFSLLVRGYKNSEIANDLSISVRTVETHRLRINQKLGHPTRAEMVRLAERAGLLRVRNGLTAVAP